MLTLYTHYFFFFNDTATTEIYTLSLHDALPIYFLPFRLGAGPMGGDADKALKLLRKLNVPLLHPIFMGRKTIDQWENSLSGFNTSEFLVSVMLPELDGATNIIPIGGLNIKEKNKKYGLELSDLTLIEERVLKLREISVNLVKLRRKKNNEKRVA